MLMTYERGEGFPTINRIGDCLVTVLVGRSNGIQLILPFIDHKGLLFGHISMLLAFLLGM